MKIIKFWAMLAVLAMLPSLAGATTISGAGGKRCGDFMEGVRLKSDEAINGYISWAQGFISGFNWSNVKGKNVAVDHGALTYWLMDYCQANPKTPFYDAMQQFIGQYAQ